MRLDVYHHFDLPDQDKVMNRLDLMSASLGSLLRQGNTIMGTTQELVALAQSAVDENIKVAAAVDALEAAVTAALAKIPSIPPEAQFDIDTAIEKLQLVVSGSKAVVADAADGVDEVAIPPA